MDPRTDMTAPANLQDHFAGTGPQRDKRPIYSTYLPPCNHACPAGENIQAWLSQVQAGNFEEAWQVLVADNPLPAVMGRICYHPCETGCNRAAIDSEVSIHAVERFLGDEALRQGWKPRVASKPSGKQVMIVGAGPSGLSAAYHLTRLGHEVTIFEAGPVAGGMMHFGIPAYRLPRQELEAEVARIEAMGVRIVLNHKVEDLLAEKAAGNFDAAFVAVGAHISKKIDIPNREAGKIMDALSFLKDVEEGHPPKLGRRVAIYGGGNTAMDAARTAKRLGYEPLIIYRRDREHMPAHDFEAEEALTEGVKINWLRTIKEIDHEAFKVEVMEIGEHGRPQPTGQFEILEADALILALGQHADTGFLQNIPGIEFQWDGTVAVASNMMTGADGIFAGGDMVPSERTATVAVGHGKKAARHIDAYLRGTRYEPAPKNPVIGHEDLQVWFKTEAPKREQQELPLTERIGFDEIMAGLQAGEATFEAKRCLSCGNCFECDGCYGACPEQAIIKLGPGKGFEVNLDLCTGCGTCVEQCPCHAMDMVPEA